MKNITQSLIKELEKYEKKQVCGLQIKAKYYDNIIFPPSEVQLLGQWFEYKATGQKNRYGEARRQSYKREIFALTRGTSRVVQ